MKLSSAPRDFKNASTSATSSYSASPASTVFTKCSYPMSANLAVRLMISISSGSKPLSEPDSRAAFRLIARVDPLVSIWFHQHEDVVDESGGRLAIERRFARLAGLGLARLPREPGSAVGWENHRDSAATAFVVELPRGALSRQRARRLAHAVVGVTTDPTDDSRR